MRRNGVRQSLAHLDAARARLVAVHHRREGVHLFGVEEDVHADDVAHLVARRLVVHGRIAVRDALERVVEVDEDLVQRQHAVQHHAVAVHRLRALQDAAAVQHDAHHVADRVARRDDARLEDWFGDRVVGARLRHLQRVVELLHRAILHRHLVDNAGGGGDDVEIELTAQTLLHDLHVEQTEEATAEAEAQRDRALVVEGESRVVEVELLKALPDLLELVRGHRVDAAEHRGTQLLETRKRLVTAEARRGDGIADLDFAWILHRAHEITGLAGLELLLRLLRGREDAHLVQGGRDARPHELHRVAALHRAVEDPHVGDHATEFVEDRVEDEGAQRRVDAARLGRRNALDDGLKHVRTANASLGGDEQRVVHRNRQDVLDLLGDAGDVRAGKIDLVQHRHDLKVRILGEVGVRDRLGFHALGGVHDEQRAFAGAHGTAHLVGEVHMAGGVDEVEEVLLPVLRLVHHRDGMALDRDSALALQVHRVERLLLQFAQGNRLGELQNAVAQGRLAVVDMRDDTEVADVFECLLHSGEGIIPKKMPPGTKPAAFFQMRESTRRAIRPRAWSCADPDRGRLPSTGHGPGAG